MKENFDRMKHRVKHMSRRSVALMLCFLIMLTAIGAGTILNVIAQGNAFGASKSGAQKAAIGTPVDFDGSDDSAPLTKKQEADLAATGYATVTFHLKNSSGTEVATKAFTGNSGKVTFPVSSYQGTSMKYYISVSDNSDIYSVGESSSTKNYICDGTKDFTLGKYNSSDYPLGVYNVGPAATSVTFTITLSGSDGKIACAEASSAHTISYNSPEHGSFTTKPLSAGAGATVNIVATPSEGYQVGTFTVTKKGTPTTVVSTTHVGNTYSFKMPDYDVTVTATFTVRSYDVNTVPAHCAINVTTSTADSGHADYNSTVNFTISGIESGYTLSTVSVKTANGVDVSFTKSSSTYSFTMPATAVTITATALNASGTIDIYFKSAGAYVYHPLITINGGEEHEMTKGADLTYNPRHDDEPNSDTGSLQYRWYKYQAVGLDLSKPIKVSIAGTNTDMEAVGTFTFTAGNSYYLGCDNLMSGSTLVDLTGKSDDVKDFYETPLHMVATAAEEAIIDG